MCTYRGEGGLKLWNRSVPTLWMTPIDKHFLVCRVKQLVLSKFKRRMMCSEFMTIFLNNQCPKLLSIIYSRSYMQKHQFYIEVLGCKCNKMLRSIILLLFTVFWGFLLLSLIQHLFFNFSENLGEKKEDSGKLKLLQKISFKN